MSIYGEFYQTVDASVVNGGISTMAISGGTPSTGGASVTLGAYWSYDPVGNTGGVTGASWYIGNKGPVSDSALTTDQAVNDALRAAYDSGGDTAVQSLVQGWFASWKAEDMIACFNAVGSAAGCFQLG